MSANDLTKHRIMSANAEVTSFRRARTPKRETAVWSNADMEWADADAEIGCTEPTGRQQVYMPEGLRPQAGQILDTSTAAPYPTRLAGCCRSGE